MAIKKYYIVEKCIKDLYQAVLAGLNQGCSDEI
jgi:hypothetical protein